MFQTPKAPDPARYNLEHQLLRSLLLSADGQMILNSITACPGAFFTGLYDRMHAADAAYVCPYTPDDFAVQTSDAVNDDGEDVLVCRIIMPEPEIPPLCHELILLSDKAHRNIRYLTVEKTIDNAAPMLCEWKSNGMHTNMGSCTDEKLQRVISHMRFGKTK